MTAIEVQLIARLKKLPPSRVAEVVDFVEFLTQREERATAAQRLMQGLASAADACIDLVEGHAGLCPRLHDARGCAIGKQCLEGLLDRAGRWLDSAKANLDVSARLEALELAATTAIANMINLIVVFLLQTVAIPSAFMWFGWNLVRRRV